MRRGRFLKLVTIGGALWASLALTQSALAQQTKIELWTFVDATADNVRSKTMAHVLRTFKANNPTIEVVANVMPWQQLSPTLLRAAKAGQTPDVAMLYSPSMPQHIAAKTIAPLQSYLAAMPEKSRTDIVSLPETRDREGTVYGIPWEMRVSGLVYRDDLLKAAGRKPPQTLQELAETATALGKGDMAGLALGFSPEAPSIATGWFLTTSVGLGAKLLNEDGSAAFVSSQTERLVQWVVDLVKSGGLPTNVALLGLEPAQQLFIGGKGVFLPSSTQRFEFIRERSKLGEAVQMMSYPSIDVGKPAPALVQSWSTVIPRGAKNPAAAWKFIEHWTSSQIQADQARMAGYVPVRYSSLSDPWFKEKGAATIRWAVDYAAKQPLRFSFPENTEALYDIWARMFGQVLTGKMNPKEGLAWAEAEYNRRGGR